MPNVNSGGTPPLLPPSQLWGPKPGPSQPVSRPATPQPAPAQPAQILPTLPPIGKSMPMLTFTGTPSQPSPSQTSSPLSGISGQMTQLRDLLKNADERLMDFYNVKILKDPNGKISGYVLNGKAASAQEVQQHLLPRSGVLHRQITDLKAEVDRTYQNLTMQAQTQLPAMAKLEQSAVQIQLQAVRIVYESFVNRLAQVDALIK